MMYGQGRLISNIGHGQSSALRPLSIHIFLVLVLRGQQNQWNHRATAHCAHTQERTAYGYCNTDYLHFDILKYVYFGQYYATPSEQNSFEF